LVLASPRHHPLAPPPTELLDPDDVGALAALQARIEGGDRVSVVGPPERRGSRLRVPLAVVPAEVAR
jgi:hypothetical protein